MDSLASDKSCPGDEAYVKAARLLPMAGVTRIADITGLDEIGLPVVCTIRPNARSLTISSGKGMTIAEARISAAMEALELFHAESFTDWRLLADLNGQIRIAAFDRLPQTTGCRPTGSAHMTAGVELNSGEPIAIPYDLVHADFRPDHLAKGSGFLSSTTGLAGGTSRDAALLHGICEVIESDAVALLRRKSRSGSGAMPFRPVDWKTVSDCASLSLLDRCQKLNIEVQAFNITTDTNIPVYYCKLVDRNRGSRAIRPTTDGSACHPSAIRALRAALCEAIQVRLILISGARDDLTARDYAPSTPPASLQESEPFVDSNGLAENEAAGASLDWIRKRIAGSGFDEVISVDLRSRAPGLHFHRVVIPGLEGYPHSLNYRAGRRALEIT